MWRTRCPLHPRRLPGEGDGDLHHASDDEEHGGTGFVPRADPEPPSWKDCMCEAYRPGRQLLCECGSMRSFDREDNEPHPEGFRRSAIIPEGSDKMMVRSVWEASLYEGVPMPWPTHHAEDPIDNSPRECESIDPPSEAASLCEWEFESVVSST